MNQWILLMTLFIAAVITIWVVILNISTIKECPAQLSNDYYTCNTELDCIYNSKYECINADKELNCLISEDLSAKQVASSMLTCECKNKTCNTIVRT